MKTKLLRQIAAKFESELESLSETVGRIAGWAVLLSRSAVRFFWGYRVINAATSSFFAIGRILFSPFTSGPAPTRTAAWVAAVTPKPSRRGRKAREGK